MKNILKIGLLGICLTALSCDDFLTKIPYNAQAIENSYETPYDIQMGVNGCYNKLVNIKRASELLLNENRSDNATYPNTENISSNYDAISPSLLLVGTTNDYVLPLWRDSYSLINRVNLLLQHLDVVIDANDRKQYEAEVKFLRGWAYFTLVRYFGGLPLLTEPIGSGSDVDNIGRASLDDTYARIEADLRDSYQLFEELGDAYSPEYGQVHQWAAKAFLGKLYMTWHKNDLAYPLLEDVYLHSGFKLTDNYEDLFVADLETTKGKEEILFPVRFTGGGLGIGNTFSTLCAHQDISDYGSNLVYWSNSLQNAFINTSDTTLDRRYPVTCGVISTADMVGIDSLHKRYPPKMVGLQQTADGYETALLDNKNDGYLDWPELRFADVILMLAEIKADANSPYKDEAGALSLIEEVRTRAEVPAITQDDVTTKFGGSVKEAVLNERRLELAFENQRFFDMVRQGEQYATDILLNFYKTEPAYNQLVYPNVHTLLTQVIGGDKVDAWRLLLPIPNDEILRNNSIEQNPGYK